MQREGPKRTHGVANNATNCNIIVLKEDVDGALTTLEGREFQSLITRLAKKLRLVFDWIRGISILSLCPQVMVEFENLEKSENCEEFNL